MKYRIVRSNLEAWKAENARRDRFRKLGESFRLASSDKPVVPDRRADEELARVFALTEEE